ncbi:MAG: hypothetical protein HKN04_13135 [Rhodothermaceae bacterium]|nr:hypothetical protein [Rhodothermaceae bacterium]
MTAFLAVEFEPEADPHFAVNALRQPTLVVTALDIGARDVVATVEVASAAVLDSIVQTIQACRGIRASTAFPVA